MSSLTLAIIQSDIHWESVDANLAMFEEKIWDIGEQVDIILLPETFNTGFSMNLAKVSEVPGLKTQKWLLQMATQKKALVGGSYLIKDGGKYFNRFFMAKPDGSFETNDKRHLFSLSEEKNLLSAGNSRNIIEYKGWKICPMVCYDLRFPVWSRNRFEQEKGTYDFDLLIYVASWPKPRVNTWDTLLKARAIENQCYVAGANRLGTDGNDLSYDGHSSIVDFAGERLKFIDNEDGVIIKKIEKAALDNFRNKLPFLKDGDSFQFPN